MHRNSAFSLVELMITVAIIALLVLLAVPALLRARERAQNTKLINELRIATHAFETYAAEYSAYPPDTSRAVLPPVMSSYFGPSFNWNAKTPIGGKWDWDNQKFGIAVGVSVVNPSASDTQMSDIDATFDDGDLNSGGFQQTNPRRFTSLLEN